MPVTFYRGAPHRHTQENEAFDTLCRTAAECMAGEEDVRVIGNVVCNGSELDALVLGNRSITIVDFKDYGGTVTLFEDDKWRTSEGVEVKGGSYPNPYQQVRRYKIRLANWLGSACKLDESNDLGHISGLVLFTQPVSLIQGAMSPPARKWFRAADWASGMAWLQHVSSPKLNLRSTCLDRIVDLMDVKPFSPTQGERMVPASSIEKAKNEAVYALLRDQDDARMAECWLTEGSSMCADYDQTINEEDRLRFELAHLRDLDDARVAKWWEDNGEWMEEQGRMLHEEDRLRFEAARLKPNPKADPS